jgi:hypothetical protein
MATKKATTGRTTAKVEPDYVEMTMAEILAGKTANSEPLPVCLDSRLNLAVDDAERALREAMIGVQLRQDDPDAIAKRDAAEEALTEAKAARRAKTAVFVFRALGRKEIEDLERDHKVTKEQISAYRDECRVMQVPPNNPPNYNFDTFPPALIAAAAVTPEITLDEATAMWNSTEFSKGELGAIFQSAWAVNNLVR